MTVGDMLTLMQSWLSYAWRHQPYALAISVGFAAAWAVVVGCSGVAPTWTPEPTWTPVPTWTPTPMRPAVDAADVAELARSSVVEIYNDLGTGTGWIYRVDADGVAWVLTNEHVVRGAETVRVRLSGVRPSQNGAVVGVDDIRDLAVVTICCNSRWEALPSASTTDVRVGSEVVALGFPGDRVGLDLSVTTGVVSSFGFHDETRSWLIQTDAALNPGNSGGPLFNHQGRVIGVVSARVHPFLGENIGFAISMRTVEEELAYLEEDAMVIANPTTTPLRVPTRVSSAVQHTGTSGELTSDPSDGSIGCSTNRNSSTVISTDTTDSAAFVRFQVPDVRQWSIGFVYHDPVNIYGVSSTATFIWSESPDNVYARHWAIRDGVSIHDAPSERISGSALRTGWNELSFRTSSDGSFLRLNDHTAIEVPASQLIRRNGWSSLCVGFHSIEDEAYSIQYSDLRTRFVREGVSGSLTYSGFNDGNLECPTTTTDHAFIASDAIDSWIVLDFVAPNVDRWSVGIVYNGSTHNNSRMIIGRNGTSYRALHTHYDNGRFSNEQEGVISDSSVNNSLGEKYRLEFETNHQGSSLFLNGEKVLQVPSSQLARRPGEARLCANFYLGETDPYTIRFSDLWAWAE